MKDSQKKMIVALENLARLEVLNKDYVLIAYVIAMKVDLSVISTDGSGPALLPKERELISHVMATVREYMTVDYRESITEIEELTAQFLQWRLSIATGDVVKHLNVNRDAIGTITGIASYIDVGAIATMADFGQAGDMRMVQAITSAVNHFYLEINGVEEPGEGVVTND